MPLNKFYKILLSNRFYRQIVIYIESNKARCSTCLKKKWECQLKQRSFYANKLNTTITSNDEICRKCLSALEKIY